MLFLSPWLTAYVCFFTALLGLVMGSFLNCTATRLVNGESVVRGRSHCGACGHMLAARDLVPVFSWLFLRGRCRHCGARISGWYPASELLTAVVYLSLVLRYDLSWKTLEMLILASLLLCISFADLEKWLIPDRLIVAGIVCRVVFILTSGSLGAEALRSLIGGLSISLPVLLLVLVMERVMQKEAMGGGDIKLLFMIGIYFDWKWNLLALILACFLGLLFAIVARKRRTEEGSRQIPFGPAIAGGAWLTMLFGERLLSYYLGLFQF